VTPTGSFNAANPAAFADLTKAGGVRELTGRVVNGQVQLFAVTGFGTGANPSPTGGTAGDAGGFANSVISLTDTGANSSFTTLATNSGASIYDGVAFTPTQTVSSTAYALTSVNGQVKVSATGAAINHATGSYYSTLTVKNTSNSAIAGGFLIQLTNLTAGVTLTGATITIGGHTYTLTVRQTANGPVVLVPQSLISSLAAGQSLPGIALQFSNPNKTAITFGDNIYSDPNDLL